MARTAEDIQTLVIQGLPMILPPRKLTADEVDGLAVGLARLLAATVLAVAGAWDAEIDCEELHRSMAADAVLAMERRLTEWRGRN